MKEAFLRTTGDVSLLKKKSKHSIRIINSHLSEFLDNQDYRKRCFDNIESGKIELTRRLEEARKTVLFSKEDLVNLLFKMKLDAEAETAVIFIEHHANLGASEDKIDFERAGFLTGVYEEAERYLETLTAIDPLDKNKPHYTILDRLELLDEQYVKTDNIPGYYSIQQDKKIAKHVFALKNLDEYWKEHLSLKDKYNVSEGFGDTRHLLQQYHNEFRWNLVKLRPREEINLSLDYHYKNYSGEKIDFLNHIEFRIMPNFDWVAGNDHLVYQSLIKEWLKTKRQKLNQVGEDYLVDCIVSVCATFVDHVNEHRKMSDENKYNSVITTSLNHRFSSKSWTAKDQSLGGLTDSTSNANRAGVAFRDLIICDEKNHHISAVEFFRLQFVPTDVEGNSNIKNHLNKIFRNEPIGLSPLFIIVYCETKSFSDTWKKYLQHIEQIDLSNYQMRNLDNNLVLNPPMANIKIAKAEHIRETNTINVYHIFINLYP